MTRKQLILNARAKGATVDTTKPDFVGVRFPRQHVYHWFTAAICIAYTDPTDDDTMFFDHSYSMNTGKAKRGLRQMLRIKTSLGFYNN